MGKVDFDKFLIDYANSGFLKKRMMVNYLLEKQGLQIVKDEILPIKQKREPKFNIGDWIVCEAAPIYTVFKIGDVFQISNDKILKTLLKYKDCFRLWDITKDAKIGDILVDRYGNVGIFKRNANGYWESFGYIEVSSVKFICCDALFHITFSCHPANKEQSELLFSKMREAGYKWNAEELRLEKIEQNQEWNEEDNLKIDTLIHVITNQKGSAIFDGLLPEELVSWLVSLKERVQPKVELTQLDKNILEAAIAFVEQNNHFNYWCGVNKRTVLSALYSLRHQNTWKPNEEQIEALRIARDRNDKIGFYLSQLYDDIKKLI